MRDNYDEDYDEDRPRPRRRRPLAAAHPSAKPVWRIVCIVVVGLMVACCGGFFMVTRTALEVIKEVAKAEPPDKAEPPREVVKWGGAAMFGTLRVKLASAGLAIYSGDSPSKRVQISNSPGLVVVVLLETDDRTKEHAVKGAHASSRLTDTLGNTIPRMTMVTEFGITCEIHGQLNSWNSYAVRSDTPLSDTLVFALPVQAATTLTLHLNAKNYGGTGEVSFEIPKAVWAQAEIERAKADAKAEIERAKAKTRQAEINAQMERDRPRREALAAMDEERSVFAKQFPEFSNGLLYSPVTLNRRGETNQQFVLGLIQAKKSLAELEGLLKDVGQATLNPTLRNGPGQNGRLNFQSGKFRETVKGNLNKDLGALRKYIDDLESFDKKIAEAMK